MMIDPKQTIYNKLSEILTGNVYQTRPEVLEVFPCITFNLIDNLPKYALDKDILKQDVKVKVDVWAESSSEAGSLYASVVEKMLEIDYTCSFYQEITDPSGIFHITTHFTF